MGYLQTSPSRPSTTDLDSHGMADKVLIATWSSSGRRRRRTRAGGTDHGAARRRVLLMGKPPSRGGVLRARRPASATWTARANLRYNVDSWAVYQGDPEHAPWAPDAKEILGPERSTASRFLKAGGRWFVGASRDPGREGRPRPGCSRGGAGLPVPSWAGPPGRPGYVGASHVRNQAAPAAAVTPAGRGRPGPGGPCPAGGVACHLPPSP